MRRGGETSRSRSLTQSRITTRHCRRSSSCGGVPTHTDRDACTRTRKKDRSEQRRRGQIGRIDAATSFGWKWGRRGIGEGGGVRLRNFFVSRGATRDQHTHFQRNHHHHRDLRACTYYTCVRVCTRGKRKKPRDRLVALSIPSIHRFVEI